MKQSGSASLMIMLCMVGMTIVLLTSLKSTIAFYELAFARTTHMQYKSAGQALTNYGRALWYVAKESPFTRSLKIGPYEGTIRMQPQGKDWEILAQLYADNKLVYDSHCKKNSSKIQLCLE